MEMLRTRIYLPVILIALLNLEYSLANTHESGLITHVIKVPNGVTPAKLIECAFHLMKIADKSFVRIAAGKDVCEQLDRRPPSLMDSSFYTEGFEYIQKSSVDIFYGNLNVMFQEIVVHHIYSEVEIGDRFSFVFQKLDSATLHITFRNTTLTTPVISFIDRSTQDFKIYKILFEVLEPHWQISINDKVLTTYDHSQPLENIAMVMIKFEQSVKYLSRAFNPRNQSPVLPGW